MPAARAISAARSTPGALSMAGVSGVSRPPRRSRTQATSAADSTLGRRRPRASPPTAATSAAQRSVPGRLTRTHAGRLESASATRARARAFWSGGTASSRSSRTSSAPESKTRARMRSLWPGPNSQERTIVRATYHRRASPGPGDGPDVVAGGVEEREQELVGFAQLRVTDQGPAEVEGTRAGPARDAAERPPPLPPRPGGRRGGPDGEVAVERRLLDQVQAVTDAGIVVGR